MIGIDTNVLVRFLVDDDPEQNRLARRFLSGRDAVDPAFVSAVTLAETVWVLIKTLGYSTSQVAEMVRSLLSSDGMIVEHGEQLGLILGDSDTALDHLADHLIAWSGALSGCSYTVTFDRRAVANIPAMELLA